MRVVEIEADNASLRHGRLSIAAASIYMSPYGWPCSPREFLLLAAAAMTLGIVVGAGGAGFPQFASSLAPVRLQQEGASHAGRGI